MSLREIVRARGGDLYAGGNRASIPAPGHSRKDRSASLLIGRTGRVIVHSFGSATTTDILADLREAGLIDPSGFPAGRARCAPAAPVLSDTAKIRRALDLWSEGVPVERTLSEHYLRHWRGILRSLREVSALRHHPHCPVAVYGDGNHMHCPALMAKIETVTGRLTAVEVTYLDNHGRRNAAIRLSRKTVGRVPEGAAVRLDPWSHHMVVAEGVITTLSATEIFDLPGAALLGAGNLRHWRPPTGVCRVTIAADRGDPGERAASMLAAGLNGAGIDAEVVLPDWPWEDFNRMALAAAGREKGRAGKGDW